MKIFTCKDRLEDIMTCIYDAWSEALLIGHDQIQLKKEPVFQQTIFDEYIHVDQDLSKAEKVIRSIRRDISDEAYLNIYLATLSVEEDALRAIYDEVQINFPDTILNEYQKVLEFNKQIGQERNRYLKENFETYKIELDNLLIELYKIEQEKSLILMEITNKSSYEKFKTYQKQLAKTEAYILNLENKLEQILELDFHL